VSDPELALDLDLAVAHRCHQGEQENLAAVFEDADGMDQFFQAVITLLNRR